jgi:hypothetical protein
VNIQFGDEAVTAKHYARVFIVTIILATICMSVSAQDPSVTYLSIPYRAPQVKLSPDNQTAAVFENYLMLSPDEDGSHLLQIRLINLNSGVQSGELSGYSDFAVDADFTPDGLQLVSLHLNGDMLVWDVGTQRMLAVYYQITTPNSASSIELVDDGFTALVPQLGPFPTVELWDIRTGAMTKRIAQHFSTTREFYDNADALRGQSLLGSQFDPINQQLYMFVTDFTASEIVSYDVDNPVDRNIVMQSTDLHFNTPLNFQLIAQQQILAFRVNESIRFFDVADSQWLDTLITDVRTFVVGTQIMAWVPNLSQDTSELRIASVNSPEVFRSVPLEINGFAVDTRRCWIEITDDERYIVFSNIAGVTAIVEI